jgi:starch phosphorylase
VFFETWRIDVGKSTVYLLDTDVPENSEQARGLTSLAYGGDMNMRIRQEIVLGIGGVKLLRALGIRPHVYHMNEGHAAFLTLELLRELKGSGIWRGRKPPLRCVFTPHSRPRGDRSRGPRGVSQITVRRNGIDTIASWLRHRGPERPRTSSRRPCWG